jgi:uncharacterized protein (TIGR03118 family)
MMRYRKYLWAAPLLLVCVLLVAMAFVSRPIQAKSGGFYRQTNLVSDIPGKARVTDPNLVNPWGLSHGPATPWWVSDNGKGVSTLYKGDGTPFPVGSPLVVTIPPPAGSPAGTTSAPTGNVFNGTSDFVVTENNVSRPSLFIFATEDGTISGWNLTVDKTNAIREVDNSASGAVYKGLALGHNASGNFLYATNFHAGTIDVFDAHFASAKLAGSFIDPKLPPCSNDKTKACFAPFGIQNINGKIYVTYALQKLPDKHDDQAGPGNGFVDVFDTSGHLLQRLISHGELNSPWGLALAPQGFGRFGKDLLVGNFGDGHINAYKPGTGAFRGQLKDQKGNPITINGLWALGFGNGALAGPTDTLFFTAGINDEADGLFGLITKGKG